MSRREAFLAGADPVSGRVFSSRLGADRSARNHATKYEIVSSHEHHQENITTSNISKHSTKIILYRHNGSASERVERLFSLQYEKMRALLEAWVKKPRRRRR